MRTSEEQWAERVRAWRDSGSTGEEFAKSIGCRVSALYLWKGELVRWSAKGVTAPSGRRETLARVLRREDSPREVCEVRVANAVIALRQGEGPLLLREVVSALAGGHP